MSRIRKTSGRVLLSAIALALPLGLAGCLPDFKPAPPPPAATPPVWSPNTTVSFFHQQIGNPATSWTTTVDLPACIDRNGQSLLASATVSNGQLVWLGGNRFLWFRAVSGTPAVAASGVVTGNCVDDQGIFAHPTLVAPADALP